MQFWCNYNTYVSHSSRSVILIINYYFFFISKSIISKQKNQAIIHTSCRLLQLIKIRDESFWKRLFPFRKNHKDSVMLGTTNTRWFFSLPYWDFKQSYSPLRRCFERNKSVKIVCFSKCSHDIYFDYSK